MGSSVLKVFKNKGYQNLLTVDKKKLDLRDQKKTANFFAREKPKAVILCAAKVGGIKANNVYKGEFIYDNITIQNNVIHSSYLNKVKSLLFLGSSCIYPKKSPQPIKESYLLKGYLEKTNEPYAVAKIAGIKLCESYNYQYGTNFKCLMPSNLFGPNDNYDLNKSHFLPAIISKLNYASKLKGKLKKISLWGTGIPRRELLYVDDLALACEKFIKIKSNDFLINIGSGKDYSIKEYADLVNKLCFKNEIKITFDGNQKLNGTLRKCLDIKVAKKYGWKPVISLNEGIKRTFKDFILNKK